MSTVQEYDKLLDEYRELQLRATKLVNVEQQLINTRDRLDHELELYKRLHAFNSDALKESSNAEFSSLIAEAIVDIFEIETSVVLFLNKGIENNRVLSIEGSLFNEISEDDIIVSLTCLAEITSEKKTVAIDRKLLENVKAFSKFKEALFYSFTDHELGYQFCIGGFVSIENAPLYQKLEERHEAFFGLFYQQVQSLFANKQKSEKINSQISKISASELELRKLSLIATRTKNGVIITDKEGKIEWVNDSFVKTTGYLLSEVVGMKPKDFLQREGVDAEATKKLSTSLSNKENVEVTIVNYSKRGKPYYNQLEITPVFDDNGNHVNFIALQKDITAETIAQQELLKVNSRFEIITQKSNIGIWDFNHLTNELSWSDLLYAQYGISEATFKGDLFEFWKEAVVLADRDRMVNDLMNVLEGKETMLDQEFEIVRANDKSVRIIKGSIIAEKDAEGELIRLVGSSIDITESRQAELKLKASEEKYRSIIENMNLGLVEIGKNGEELFSNKKIKEITSLDNPGVLGLSIDYEQSLKDKINKGLISGYRIIGDSVFEIDYFSKDDKKINLLVSAAPLLNQQGGIDGFISIFLDITQLKMLQKNLEEALHERDSFIQIVNSMKLFYESILNHSPAEIKVINPDLFLTYANSLILDNEIGMEEKLGSKISEIGEEGSQERLRYNKIVDKVQQAVDLNRMIQLEELRYDKNGEERFLLENILPHYNTDGDLEHIVISGVDITDLKKVQFDVLQKNEELKKINAELDNFVYSVSHDLRSPLLSIKGVISLVLSTPDLGEKNAQYLKLAESSVLRLDGTIQEILEYSRNARLEITPTEFDIREMVDLIFADLKYASKNHMDYILELTGPAVVVSDKSRMNTLLKNLIGNSVKYSRTDISDSFVRVEISSATSYLVIKVIDNGEGIAPKNINKIFDMYYRGSSSSVGTGLGLYICKEILNKLNGAVTVKSIVKVGTTMTITLPILKK